MKHTNISQHLSNGLQSETCSNLTQRIWKRKGLSPHENQMFSFVVILMLIRRYVQARRCATNTSLSKERKLRTNRKIAKFVQQGSIEPAPYRLGGSITATATTGLRGNAAKIEYAGSCAELGLEKGPQLPSRKRWAARISWVY